MFMVNKGYHYGACISGVYTVHPGGKRWICRMKVTSFHSPSLLRAGHSTAIKQQFYGKTVSADQRRCMRLDVVIRH